MDIPSYRFSRPLYTEYNGVRVAEEGFSTVEIIAEGVKQMKIAQEMAVTPATTAPIASVSEFVKPVQPERELANEIVREDIKSENAMNCLQQLEKKRASYTIEPTGRNLAESLKAKMNRMYKYTPEKKRNEIVPPQALKLL